MKPILSTKITRQKRAVGDYIPSGETNIDLTFRKARRRLALEAEAERAAKVTPIKRAKA